MKKTLLLFSVVALIGSVTARADGPKTRTPKTSAKKVVSHPLRQQIYITNVSVTGSHIPIVVTRYGNDVHANSSFIAYTPAQLDQTGQLNVGDELSQRDPAISSAHFSRR